MRADFSRGHRPDDKRGQRYRRVLSQQGRLWLDSDVAASVDATDRLIRHLAKDTGCPAGSPDTGFLASPGAAFAWFDSLDHVEGLPAAADPFRAFRDYAVKYMERFPSLYFDARAAAGTLIVGGRQTFELAAVGKLRLWVKLAPGAPALTMTVNGVNVPAPVPIPGNFGFDAFDYDIAAANIGSTEYAEIELGFQVPGANSEAWVGFIEGFNAANLNPLFWITEGRYYVDGLEVEFQPDTAASTFLDPFAALPPATQFVAYLEAWERLITHVEESGIKDSALGGLDTSVRTRPIGQVKFAAIQGNAATLAELISSVKVAFQQVDFGLAELTVAPALVPPNPDPCAIPIDGGYNADENRFYRFEVHVGGDLGTCSIKWSRNNGSELYAASVNDAPAGQVALVPTPGTAPPMRLVENDLVEILTEAIEMADAAVAEIILATPTVVPAERSVGQLALVQLTDDENVVVLLDAVTKVVLDLTSYGVSPIRLRKWDGLIASVAPPSVHVIEDGLQFTLGGSSFGPGDYWQFEARRQGNNGGSPWQITRHGPERLLTPLALFMVGPDATAPLELQHWFDDRFRPICELRADDIYYDGAKSETEADTVQEAIDELYELVEKDGGGCCDATLEPSTNPAVDDTPRIQALIDAIPSEGKVCLERGVYRFETTVVVENKDITIEGCPHAIVEGTTQTGPVFSLGERAKLTVSDLIVRATGTDPIIGAAKRPSSQGPTNTLGITILRSKLVHVGTGHVIHDEITPIPMFALNTDSVIADPPADDSDHVFKVKIERSTLAGRFGVLVHHASSIEILESVLTAADCGVAIVAPFGKPGASVHLHHTSLACSYSAAQKATLLAALATALGEEIDQTLLPGGSANPGSLGIGVFTGALRARESTILGDCAVAFRTGIVACESSAFDGARGQALWGETLRFGASESQFASVERAAVHILKPAEVDVDRCQFRGQVGIVLLTSTDLQSPLDWKGLDVRIAASQFDIERVSDAKLAGGILIGAAFFASLASLGLPSAASRANVLLSDNTINLRRRPETQVFGVMMSVKVLSQQAHDVRVLRNVIRGQGQLGIAIQESSARLEGNEVDMQFSAPLDLLAAIAVFGGTQHLIANNSLVCRTEEEVAPAGILVWSSSEPSRSQIKGNQVHDRSPAPIIFPVFAGAFNLGIRELTIEDNALQGKQIWIFPSQNLLVRDNQMSVQNLILFSPEDSTVHGNRVLGRDDVGLVFLSNARRLARVAHNHCSELHVLPRAIGTKEDAIVLQVADNMVTRNLNVGSPSTVPDETSRVQVLGNQTESLTVSLYNHAVIASNLAANYTPATLAAASTASRILVHNHNA